MSEHSGPLLAAPHPVEPFAARREPPQPVILRWWPLVAVALVVVLAAGALMQQVKDLDRRTGAVEQRLERIGETVSAIAARVGAKP